MKRIYNICIVAVACLITTLCNSCTVEEPIPADGYTYTMQIDAVLNGFEGSATRSAYDWPDGAKLYMQFHEGENRVQGFAEYNESKHQWTVTTRTALSNVVNGTCEAYYFEHYAELVDEVELSESVAIYQDREGTYINDDNALTVSLTLTPRTGRIRFRGEVGCSFNVSGLNHLSAYEVLSNSFSTSSESLSLTVSEDGYTPYIYVSFPDTSRTLTIVYGNMRYTRECPDAVLLSGRSGNMALPTAASHDAWIMEEANQIDESAVAEAVDLGLSVKWASWNVGATSPEKFGGYYAWGETETKSNYTLDNSVTYGLSISQLESQGIIGSDGNLTADYDAATVNWGNPWRMPTQSDIEELVSVCTWDWSTQNGVKGYKVTGPNGNSIFLPAAGYRYGTLLDIAGSSGGCWSAMPDYYLYFDSSDYGWYGEYRCNGFSVRPVYGQRTVSITTGDAVDITDYSATLCGTISNSTQSVTCGIIYGTSSTLSSTSGTMKSTASSGIFSVDVTGLSSNTTYYYRAYAVVDGGYRYGAVHSFTTESVTPGDVIDLGLSVKWASCNVGAESPEDYGDYFAWGETEEKDNYDWSTYKWCNGSSITLTKYCTNSSYGTVDNKTVLDSEDDAATVILGTPWRMPTLDEIKELIDDCTWSWTTKNGVNGYKVMGPNGNSIFLPAAGYRVGTEVNDSGSLGYYWLGMLHENYSNRAYNLSFHVGGGWSYDYRYHGFTVRPVTAK